MILPFFTPGPLMPTTERLIEIGVRLGYTLLVALLFQRLLFLLVGRIEKLVVRAGGGKEHAVQRAHTLGGIFRSLCTVFVGGGALIHGIEILGWNVGPLLAGAGVLGVAVGFGAQTLVRDLIAGLFILAEDQFSVGDSIEFDGRAATVEALTVRATTLRDFNGFLHFVPNGEIRVVTNRSRGWNRVATDVTVAVDQDLDRALAVCRDVVKTFNADPAWSPRLLEPAEVWGIESLTSQDAQLRMVVRARPGGDAHEAARELRRRVHGALLAAGLRPDVQRAMRIVSLPTAATPDTPDTRGPS
jgi:small conductance mechanosensitive channel